MTWPAAQPWPASRPSFEGDRLTRAIERLRELRRQAAEAHVAAEHGLLPRLRRVLTVTTVVLATVAGAVGTMAVFSQSRELSVGQIQLSIDPGHRGALDVYVPLVDWGVRYEAIRAPVRLSVDLRTVDRTAVERLASAGTLNAHAVQAEARDAIAGYLRTLIVVVVLISALIGMLVALTVRSRAGPRLRSTAGTAVGVAVAVGVLLVVTLPPRGTLDTPQYYASGSDIPQALRVLENAQRSTGTLNQELDAQLVGLARLVVDPAARTPLTGAATLTIASDLHNNLLALPILGRIAHGAPLLFPGDLTDRGSPIEVRLLRQIIHLGKPFVFVTGNHDSDALGRSLARRGAIVLTEDGRLNRQGEPDPEQVVVRVGGLRMAGYGDPFVRLRAERYRDRYDNAGPTSAQQVAFARWLRPLIGHVDVVLVHEPQLLTVALEELREDPPRKPLVFAVGHTHRPELTRQGPVTVINGGSVGAGGTGGLAEGSAAVGIARLVYRDEGTFTPLAADLVSVDPGTGSSTARRERLDTGD